MSGGERVQALLVTDGTPASDSARKKLVQAGIMFNELKSKDVGSVDGTILPAILAREGDFEGTERIDEFLEIVG